MELSVLREYGNTIENILKLKTFVLAVKLLESKKDNPSNAKRPTKDFGHHLSLCQSTCNIYEARKDIIYV